MDNQIIDIVTWLLLTEALTHAVKNWGIFDGVRSRIVRRSVVAGRLLACFECTSVWISAAALAYLVYVDFWPLTFIIIIARAATIAHIAVEGVDAWRAATTSKI